MAKDEDANDDDPTKVYEKKDPKVPLRTIATTEPMDLVHVDLVGMEVTIETKKKPVVQKILVVTDHFSQFIQAYKVKDKRAISIAKCLYWEVLLLFDSEAAVRVSDSVETVNYFS